jgi:hypothetical protein
MALTIKKFAYAGARLSFEKKFSSPTLTFLFARKIKRDYSDSSQFVTELVY